MDFYWNMCNDFYIDAWLFQIQKMAIII